MISSLPDVTIRPAVSDDIPAIVDLLNVVNPSDERITVEEFHFGETMRHPRDAFNRLLAASASRTGAMSDTGNAQSRPPHMFRLVIAVHPDFRRRGLGTELERRQRAFALDHGAGELTAHIRESDATSRVFLEWLGYREAFQRFEMELDVGAFDWGRFDGWESRLAGLRLFTFADLGATDQNIRKMYELTMELVQDVPYPDGPPQFSYDEFKKYFDAPGFRPDGLFVLADGDAWVGTSGLLAPEGRPGYTYFTGIRRTYRGRGLATALKLATIGFARRTGVAAMRTTNDTVNYAMVAVNEKLGYRRLPARVGMKWTP